MSPQRIQLSRKKGWRMPENTVKVDRTTKWGNPYTVDVFGVDLAIELYSRSITGYWSPDGIPDALIDKAYELHQEMRRKYQRHWLNPESNLRGYNLACWCSLDQPCHADVLLKLANQDKG